MSRDLLLITGASSDIGLALMQRMLSAGDATILAHYNAGLDRIEALMRSSGGDRIHPLPADFTSIASVEAMMNDVAGRFGAPSQIVHLPAMKLRYERFPRFDVAHFNRDLTIQVLSAAAILGKAIPKMAKMPRAKVVFLLSSVTRGIPPKFMSMYTIVKHAQLGLMRSLASEYAATGISVNAVSPGMVDTRFLDDIPELAKQMATSAAPRGRLAAPGDVIGAIEFLLSPASDFITGIEIPVTGGGGA